MKTAEGRIIRSLSGFYEVQTENGTVTCRGRGSLRRSGDSPLTGDLVKISIEQGKGMVEAICPGKIALCGRRLQTWMPWWCLPPT